MTKMTERMALAKSELTKAVRMLRQVVEKTVAPTASFEDREAAWLAAGNEAMRVGLEADLQGVSDGCGPEVLVDGERYRRHQGGEVPYGSLCGPLVVRRFSYRRVGERNGRTVIPMELAAGIIENATPALAFSVAQGFAKHDMRSHREDLVAAHRLPPSRTTLERIAQRVGDEAGQSRARIDAYVRRDEALPEGAHALSLGLDRVAVPMEEPRPAAAPARPRRSRKPRVRKTPAPVDVNYRMAYVGTVAIVDADGEVLATRKYAIPAADDPATLVVDRMMADVVTLRRKKPSLAVGIVQDGAPEMWNLLVEGIARHGIAGPIHQAIDRYHLTERLGKALAIVEPNEAIRKRTLQEWTVDFDRRDSAIDVVQHRLIKHHAQLPPAKAAELWEHLVYLRRNKNRMRYVSLRLAGLPVGSGVTEGSCKSVVGKRARGSGQRWHDRGLRNALTLRALHQSDRLLPFWSHLARRYTAQVANA